MPREFVEYTNDLPIKVSMQNIKKSPIHWHNAMEVIYVLEGSIKIIIETESHRVNKQEIGIINPEEAHSIKSITNNNKVLIFQIDTSFFNKYYDIENMFFYTDFSAPEAQKHEKYDVLRKYLSTLLCEIAQKGDNYEDVVEEILVDLLYHLINNFHYLIYDEEELKENEVQFERYDRIIKYIYSNYNNKISIQDIARLEFLSSHYLSNEMKNKVGYSFNDFVNLTRVEEAIKLLLDTDKTISEISEELGFSHTRYFNKHFKKHYKCTPMQYRKKYKVDEETYENLKVYEKLKLKDAYEYLMHYLEDYPRFNYEGKIIKINVDLSKDTNELEEIWHDIINLGSAKEILKGNHGELIKEFQKYVECEYAIIQNIFSKDMNVFSTEKDRFFNWYEIRQVFEFIYDLDLKPAILIDFNKYEVEFFLALFKDFMDYFTDFFGDKEIKKWRFYLKNYSDKNSDILESFLQEYEDIEFVNWDLDYKEVNNIYDTAYMLPYILNQYLNEKSNVIFLTTFDEIYGGEYINNELFYGGSGIINRQGIKKPSYYSYYLLSKLGNEVIEKGDGYIITKEDDDIQILVYSHSEELESLISLEDLYKRRGLKETAEKKFSINIAALPYNYKIVTYKIDEGKGSSYNNWLSMGRPKRIDEYERDLLIQSSVPNIKLGFAKKSPIYNIVSKIEGYGAFLFILQRV
ncbi:helix-turn-helix domain-containing protein [Clostridium sporogenes]|uniref:AraC family transcriptional regulator n=1 Tax=Clostridium sp. LCP25S3_F10 TaxID=3438750 RepID=UPI0013D18CDE|nr:helix-turn-helix domain-containing protein [Clostridium sporogenes]NFS26663.1 helix-turn-helix domain-containing protein [Clostridium sporogenes]